MCCPITCEPFGDPVKTSNGITYDRKAIKEWFEHNDTSPMTNLRLENLDIQTNHIMYAHVLEAKNDLKDKH